MFYAYRVGSTARRGLLDTQCFILGEKFKLDSMNIIRQLFACIMFEGIYNSVLTYFFVCYSVVRVSGVCIMLCFFFFFFQSACKILVALVCELRGTK